MKSSCFMDYKYSNLQWIFFKMPITVYCLTNMWVDWYIYIWNVCSRAPNEDYTPGNLQTVTDNIYLNLFDQVLIDIQEVRTNSD